MSKLKTVIVVLLLVLLAGGGAFYGLLRYIETDIVGGADDRLAEAEKLLVDGLRVDAFALIEKLAAERRNTSLAEPLAAAEVPADQATEGQQAAHEPLHQQLLPVVKTLQSKHGLKRLAAVALDGTILAAAPQDAFGKSIKGLPAFQDCTAGVARDGLYELEGQLRQVGLSPVENAQGEIVGCLMASRPLGSAAVKDLARRSGLEVALLLRKKIAAATVDPAAIKELAPLAGAKDTLRFGQPSAPLPLLIDLTNKGFVARTIRIPGGTDPVHLAAVVDLAAELSSLREAQMMILYATGGLFVFGLLLGLLLSGRALTKDFDRLRDSVRLMAEGNGYTIEPDNYSGPYRELAVDLKRMAESSRPAPSGVRPPESVSQILGSPQPPPGGQPEPPPAEPAAPAGAEADSLDFESLLGGGQEAAPVQEPSPPAAPPPAPAPEPPAPAAEPAAPAPPAQPAAPPAGPPAPEPPQPAAPTPAPSAPPAQQAADDGKGPRVDMPGDLASFFEEDQDDATREFPDAGDAFAAAEQKPAPAPPPAAPSPPPAPQPQSAPPPLAEGGFDSAPDLDTGEDEDDEDERPDATVIAQVPDELLKAAATKSTEPEAPSSSVPPPPTSLPKPPVAAPQTAKPTSPDEAHFEEVYQQFLQTKKECGESTAGLTKEKFVEKLRKNSADLKARYRCKAVRFQVYVKAGKAALKATPIK